MENLKKNNEVSDKENEIFNFIQCSEEFDKALIDVFDVETEEEKIETMKKIEELKNTMEKSLLNASKEAMIRANKTIEKDLGIIPDDTQELENASITDDDEYKDTLEQTANDLNTDEEPNTDSTENEENNDNKENNFNTDVQDKKSNEQQQNTKPNSDNNKEGKIKNGTIKNKLTATQTRLAIIVGFVAVVIVATFVVGNLKGKDKKEEIQIASKNTAIKLDDINEDNKKLAMNQQNGSTLANPDGINEEQNIEQQEQQNNTEIPTNDDKEIDAAINNVNNGDDNKEEVQEKPKPEKIAIAFLRKNYNSAKEDEQKQEKNDNDNKTTNTRESNVYKYNQIKKSRSEYEVKQGSVLPAILITEINTDLPGTILGKIRENVYDTVTGDHLLIPKGSKLFGRYESQIPTGQNRVLIVWDKLILPNGKYLDLVAMQGADNMGNSGLKDGVNRHIIALLGRSILSSILNIGNNLSKSVSFGIGGHQFGLSGQPNQEGKNVSPFEQASAKILQQGVDRKPTITIRKGFKFNVIVNEDLGLEPYKYK
jgi:conjugal transfer protein trbI